MMSASEFGVSPIMGTLNRALAEVFVVMQPFALIPKDANADALNPSPAAVVGRPQFTGVVGVASTA
jgi:hypothetical protein